MNEEQGPTIERTPLRIDWQEMLRLAAFAAAYWLVVRLGLLFVAQPEGIASIWPASGFTLAILLLRPHAQWPRLLGVIFVVNALGNWSGGNSLPVSLGFALANTLEPALGGWVLTRLYKIKINFERVTDVIALLGTAVIANGLTALVGTAVVVVAFNSPWFNTWLLWWTSDGLGIIMVTPVLVTWLAGKETWKPASLRIALEISLLVAVMSVFAWLLFGPFTAAEKPLLRNYMFFPFLIWLAYRLKPRGVAASLLLFGLIAVWNTVRGTGIFSFSTKSLTDNLLSLQLFLFVETCCGLLLTAVYAERNDAHEALVESQELFSQYMRHTPIYSFIKEVGPEVSRVLIASENFHELIGPAGRDMVGKSMQELFPLEFAAKMSADDWEVVSKGEVLSLDEELNGRHFTTIKFPIVQNKRTLLAGYTIDITERVQAERALKESEVHYRALVEGMPGIVYTFSKASGGTFYSSRVKEILGYTPEQLYAEPMLWNKSIHPEDEVIISRVVNATEEGKPYQVEYRIRDANGNWHWFDDRSFGIHLHNGDGFVDGLAMDITERKHAEEALVNAHSQLERRVVERTAELSAANLRLEKAARMKDEFMASMSHELRTPLTGILGLAEVLQMPHNGPLTEKQNKYLTHIRESGQHLLELINEILDISKLEAGKFKLDLQKCSLLEICRASLEMTSEQAYAKKLHYSLSIEPESIALTADPLRLKQIVINLLSNAVKFTPEGGNFGIDVRASEAENQVEICVWDTGIGIKEEDLPRLFQTFVQLDARLARQYTGSGLGLSLVRQLAELHGGSVSVQSKTGEGSRFTVRLPLK